MWLDAPRRKSPGADAINVLIFRCMWLRRMLLRSALWRSALWRSALWRRTPTRSVGPRLCVGQLMRAGGWQGLAERRRRWLREPAEMQRRINNPKAVWEREESQ